MKIIPLYSKVDAFIIAGLALISAAILFNLMVKRLNFQKKTSDGLLEGEVDIDLDAYILNFNVISDNRKKIGFTTKLVLGIIALAIICIPLNKIINC